jgi:hypothetical protein
MNDYMFFLLGFLTYSVLIRISGEKSSDDIAFPIAIIIFAVVIIVIEKIKVKQ